MIAGNEIANLINTRTCATLPASETTAEPTQAKVDIRASSFAINQAPIAPVPVPLPLVLGAPPSPVVQPAAAAMPAAPPAPPAVAQQALADSAPIAAAPAPVGQPVGAASALVPTMPTFVDEESISSREKRKLFAVRYQFWQTRPLEEQKAALTRLPKRLFHYTTDQRALVCSIWKTAPAGSKGKVLESIQSIKGFETVSKQSIALWVTNRAVKKRGTRSIFEFESLVLQECLLYRVESTGSDDVEKLVVEVNLCFNYDVVRRSAERVRQRVYNVEGKMVKVWMQHPKVKRLKFSDKWVWSVYKRAHMR